jgi:3-oxoacyl-[acyl-carrier protein] reductase
MPLTFAPNRIAVVTGAGRGIGKAIAASLAREGVRVVCVSKSETCKSVAEEITTAGGQAEALMVDVSDGVAVAAACAELNKKFGKIDILVNNAGITRDNLLLRMKDEDWTSVINTNLNSCFFWTKGLVHQMSRGRWGRIVNISSVVGLHGNAGQSNYAAAKAGQIGFTKAIAKEYAARNVTSNAIAPGFIRTDMTAELGEEAMVRVTERVALKRLGEAGDIAATTVYLCSEEAGYITGQVFAVDGGLVL